MFKIKHLFLFLFIIFSYNFIYTFIDVYQNRFDKLVSLSPNLNYIALANTSSDILSIIDVSNFKVIKKISIGTSPVSVAWSPNGDYIAVANSELKETIVNNSTLSIIDVSNFKVIKKISIDTNPTSISWSSNGRYIFVVSSYSNTIFIVDSGTFNVIKTLADGINLNSESLSKRDNSLTNFIRNCFQLLPKVIKITGPNNVKFNIHIPTEHIDEPCKPKSFTLNVPGVYMVALILSIDDVLCFSNMTIEFYLSVQTSPIYSKVSYNGSQTLNITISGGNPPYKLNCTGPGFTEFQTLNGTGTPISTTVTINNIMQSALYNIVVTDSNNNEVNSGAFIEVKIPSLLVNISPETSMVKYGNSQTLTASISGGIPPYTLVWTGPNFSQTQATYNNSSSVTVLGITQSSLYNVIVTDNYNQKANSSALINVEIPNLEIDITPITSSVLYGGSQTLTASISGGIPPYTLVWTGPNFNETQTTSDNNFSITVPGIIQSGTYNVVVTDSYNQKANSRSLINIKKIKILLEPATQSIAKNSTLLLKALVKGGVGPYKYIWTKPDGSTVKTISNIFYKQNAQPIDSGTYFVTVVDSIGQTLTSNSALVFVN